MIGDKLVIEEYHEENGKRVSAACLPKIQEAGRVFTLTVAGESGSGKSETAATTARELEKAGYKVAILGQDDYFKLPPKSNSAKRKEDISWVGLGEVHLDLMDEHLKAAKDGATSIVKPNVVFEEDRISEETISLDGIDVVIAEGTYTTSLNEADFHAFIDKTYHDTLAHRKKRAREATEGEFIEAVLEIEHKIISGLKSRADIILPKGY
ncbi:MAG: zeta toxin family protein [Deltaproteobacteria bacterium]|nr:zeta toxin family protein [Deltaproteobacteria bacterium]MBN2671072.1 zeta toxin family protein [Deltaproteobacteria bacterium]